MKRAAVVAVVALVAGCGVPTARQQFPEERVCGTIAEVPVRVADVECSRSGRFTWYSADPFELDSDDYTPIGAELDDDYLGPDVEFFRAPSVISKPKATSKPKSTSKPKATRSTTKKSRPSR